MSSIQTLTRRIEALEARLAEVEGGYGDTLYEVRRDTIETKLNIGTILDHLGLAAATQEQIDAVIRRETGTG